MDSKLNTQMGGLESQIREISGMRFKTYSPHNNKLSM